MLMNEVRHLFYIIKLFPDIHSSAESFYIQTEYLTSIYTKYQFMFNTKNSVSFRISSTLSLILSRLIRV